MCEIKKEGNRAATQLPCRGKDKILANKLFYTSVLLMKAKPRENVSIH